MAALWVCLCAYLNCAGWILSALHALNPTGYVIALGLGAALAYYWRDAFGLDRLHRFNFRKLRRRYSRLLPAGFAIVAALAILGGVLHPPSNYDALAYRVPRVLHWLAAEQWHWVYTDFQRLNTRAAAFEWVAAPLTALLRTDRLWFLINAVSQLLLPGLVFSLYRRLGVSPRAAWSWMWLLPTGYSFVLQGGGIGNDLFGTVFALASVNFALRARASGRFRDVAVSALAVALLTSSKTSNLPLCLPWLLALLPCWRLALGRPLATLIVTVAAVLSSFAPTALMNYRNVSDWSGAHAENMYPERYDPRVTLPGNLLALTVQNLAPPVFPFAAKWNEFAPRLMTESFHARMKTHFEPSAANLVAAELHNEEFSGFGFGLSCLVTLSLMAGWRLTQGEKRGHSAQAGATVWVRWSPWFSALVYAAKTAIGTTARIFTPYYLLLLPALLTGKGAARVGRQKWWRAAAVMVYLLAATAVILTPSRPLWPANTILSALAKRYPGNAKIERARTVFFVYSQRADSLAAIRDLFPADQRVIGVVTGDDPETSLWRPFGSRRLIHVRPSDTREQLLAKGIHYIAVNEKILGLATPFPEWLEAVGGQNEQTVSMHYRASFEPFTWHLVRLD